MGVGSDIATVSFSFSIYLPNLRSAFVLYGYPISQDFWEIKHMRKQWIPGTRLSLSPPTESVGTKLMYTMVIILLIDHLGVIADVKQTWYDDNATAAGILHSTRCWWNYLVLVGPAFGYHAHASKTWLLMKEEHLDQAKIIFKAHVNTTTHGQHHFGPALGSKKFEWFVSDRVHLWRQELLTLNNIVKSQPHNALEKGPMSWLTSLPLKELNLTLHKSAFQDAFALRYGRLPKDIPTHCSCGSNFSTEHALSVQRVVLQ